MKDRQISEPQPHKAEIMKSLGFVLVLVITIIIHTENISAFDQASVDRLRRSNTCAGCDLYRANFNGENLNNANLKGANLAYATFRKATLYMADLSDADLRGTVFEGATWVDGTICQTGSVGKCVAAPQP